MVVKNRKGKHIVTILEKEKFGWNYNVRNPEGKYIIAGSISTHLNHRTPREMMEALDKEMKSNKIEDYEIEGAVKSGISEEEKRILKEGACEYCKKPFEPHQGVVRAYRGGISEKKSGAKKIYRHENCVGSGAHFFGSFTGEVEYIQRPGADEPDRFEEILFEAGQFLFLEKLEESTPRRKVMKRKVVRPKVKKRRVVTRGRSGILQG